MPLVWHELEIAPAHPGIHRWTSAQVLLLRDQDSLESEIWNGKTEIVMAVTSDDCDVLELQIFQIQKNNIEDFCSGCPMAIDNRGKRVAHSSRVIQHPEVMVAKTNGDRAHWETVPQTFQCFLGLLRAREIARHDERIRPIPGDPFSNLQQRRFLRCPRKVQ